MPGISGTPQPKQPTSNARAWLGGNYSTLKLASDLSALRVGAPAVGARPGDGGGNGRSPGRWFAVGDVIVARTGFTNPRELPGSVSAVDWCRLRAGSIVNVGRCSPIVGHMGGGEQVEWVSGPMPEPVPATES